MVFFISSKNTSNYRRFQSHKYLQRVNDKVLMTNAVVAKTNECKAFMGTGNTCRTVPNSDLLANVIFITFLKKRYNDYNITAQTSTVMKLLKCIRKNKVIVN